MTRTVLLIGAMLLVLGVAPAGEAQEPQKSPPASPLRSQTTSQKTEPRISFEERLLVTIPLEFEKPYSGWSATFSRDGAKVVYAARQRRKEFIVFGDKRGPRFDFVGALDLSPDGSTVGYQGGRMDGRSFVVVGDKLAESQSRRPVLISREMSAFFSPDGTRVVYARSRGGKYSVVVIDASSLVYKTMEKGEEFTMVQGNSGPEFDEVTAPKFSPDGTTVAYGAREGKKAFILIGDKRGPEFEDVHTPIFSPDGSTVAYAAKQAKKWFIMVGDKRGPESDGVGPPVFSPDRSTVAYGAKQGKKEFIIVGDKRGPEFDWVGHPIISANGSTVAYWAKLGKKEFIVVGDKKGPEFDGVADPVFSPDGSKVAYGALAGRELWWKVMDVR